MHVRVGSRERWPAAGGGAGEGGPPLEAGVGLQLRVAPGGLLFLLQLVLQVLHSPEEISLKVSEREFNFAIIKKSRW